jgi:hypothetical protein
VRKTLAVGLAVWGLAAMACSRPSGAVEVPPERLPFPLARTPVTPPPVPGERLVTVYLVRDGRLSPATRLVSGELGSAEAAMRALLLGPSQTEREAGIGTAIPPATQLIAVEVTDQVALVDLSAEFQGPAEPPEVLLRVGQVVWTLVADPGIASVRFSIDGVPTSVPIADGTAPDRPVTASDYGSVAPLEEPVVTNP